MTGFEKTWPAYCQNVPMAQCVFLVLRSKNVKVLTVFVIFMSKKLSTNLCDHLRRVNISYKREISLASSPGPPSYSTLHEKSGGPGI